MYNAIFIKANILLYKNVTLVLLATLNHSASIYLPHMQCLMVKMCNFDQKLTKATVQKSLCDRNRSSP